VKIAWICRDTARSSNRGGTKTRSAHFLIASVEGIAERTPKRRAS
jgi:hypothetical protein